MSSHAATSVVLASVGDPEGTRTVTAIIALLVVLGIGLVMLAFWLFRSTRPDAELLAPLEVMGERKWRNADPVWQRRRLDEVRPAEAQPLQPSAAPPDFDEAFDLGPAGSGFDDLHEDQNGVPAGDGPVEQEPPAAPAPAKNGDGGSKPVPRATAPTPIGLPRPELDEFPERDLDPDVMAAAIAELEQELGGGRDRDVSPDEH